MKPLIGINLDIEKGPPPVASVQVTYLEAVQKAGGIPVLLPPMPDFDLDHLLNQLHGLLLIGGLDYSPLLYGEDACDRVECLDPTRQEFDLRLVRRTLDRSVIPVLGICGGCQLLNISLGGSLIQDIKLELPDSAVGHSKPDGWKEGFAKHAVMINQDSTLARIYQADRLAVPTSHHQAVRVLGSGLKAAAHAEDGIIEAVELPERGFTIGVQWHPERDYDGNRLLFEEFIKRSADNRNRG